MPIQTDIEIKAKDQTLCSLMCPSPLKRTLSKYKDLKIKVERTWGIKATTIIPVAIGVIVLIKKGLGKYVQHIPGKIKMHELQKITLLGTSHILRTLHQIDFYLILNLGSRNGPGYSVVLWYSIKKDNNNNNNNNNFSVAHWHTFVMRSSNAAKLADPGAVTLPG